MSWPPGYLADLADQVTAALAELEAGLRLEQAPHGLDEWQERAVQRALAAGLARHHEVACEVHYPSSAGRKLSHRQRCDVVLSARGRPLAGAQPSLFDECPAEQALWLELKVARQRRPDGRGDARYGAQWRRNLIADLHKMAAEPLIHDAALVLIAFTADQASFARDLDGFESLMVRNDVVAGFRQVRSLPIVERIGHRLCGVALWPTVQRG